MKLIKKSNSGFKISINDKKLTPKANIANKIEEQMKKTNTITGIRKREMNSKISFVLGKLSRDKLRTGNSPCRIQLKKQNPPSVLH